MINDANEDKNDKNITILPAHNMKPITRNTAAISVNPLDNILNIDYSVHDIMISIQYGDVGY
jgi:hypothetical protein